jgi:hypothetical protein
VNWIHDDQQKELWLTLMSAQMNLLLFFTFFFFFVYYGFTAL